MQLSNKINILDKFQVPHHFSAGFLVRGRLKVATALKMSTNVKTIPANMEYAAIQMVASNVLATWDGPRMKMKRAAQKIKMSVKHLSILVYMELALIQKVVLIALAMKGGRRKKMKTYVLRTLTNASLKILVDMETAQIQRVVSYATVI